MPGITSRNQQGKREDLADYISVIDVKECPLISMIPKGKEPANDQFSWQADSYPQPKITGTVDGKDVSQFENFSARQRLWGRIQISDRAPMVSTVAQEVENPAGIGKRQEFAKAVTKAMTMVKRDMESRAGSQVDSQPDDGVNPYLTRGLFTWIQSTPQTDLPVPPAYLTPVKSILTVSFASLTESMFRDGLLGSVWDQTGKMGQFKLLLGRQLKALFSGWTIYYPTVAGQTIVRKFQEWDDERLLAAVVDTIQGDFGTIDLFPTPWLRQELTPPGTPSSTPSSDPGEAPTLLDIQQRCGLLLDIDMLELRYNQKPYFEPLEDKGGGPRGLVRAIWALICKNPLGFGKVQPLGL